MAIVKGGASAPVPVSTAQVTGYGTTTSVLVRDVGSKIFYLDPSASPFTLLTDRAGSRSASNPRFEWYEKALRDKATQVNAGGGYTDGEAGAVTVDNGLVFQVGDIVLMPRYGEVARVSSCSSTTVTLGTRGIGSTTAATMSDNDDIFVVGSAFVEGADVGIPDEWQETQKYNNTQVFRRPFGATGTREASESYFGKSRPVLRAEKAIEHAMDIERAYMFGYREETTSTNSIWRTTGGFIEWAQSNALDLLGATITEPDLEGWMEDVFAHTAAGDSRVLFCSAQVITALDQLAADRLRLVPSDQTYGIAVKQFLTSHGTLNIVKHRLLVNGSGGYGYGDWAFCVDPKALANRTLNGRATKLLVDRQGPGVDGWVDEYLTESGLEFHNAEVHGTVQNVGAAA